MKTNFMLSLGLLLFLSTGQAQDFTSTKNVLLDMRSGSSPDVLNALDDYKMQTDREKKLYNRNMDSLRVMMQYIAYEADYYFSLGVSVDLAGVFSGLSSGVKPTIVCDIKVFSPDRDVVKDVDTRYKVDEGFRSWDFPEHNFDKLAFDHIMILAKKLKPYVEEAVKEVVAKM